VPRRGRYRQRLPGFLKRLVRTLFHCRSSSELLDHAIEIGIARAKAPSEPIPTALGNPLAVSDNLELADLPWRNDGFNVEALLDEGHETRDLDLVVLSRRAVNDLDLHSVPQSASCSHLVAYGSSNYGVAVLGARQCRDAASRVSTGNYFSNTVPQQLFGSQHLIHRAGAESLQIESNEFESKSFEHGGELAGHLGG
jgi:hypothetical protein